MWCMGTGGMWCDNWITKWSVFLKLASTCVIWNMCPNVFGEGQKLLGLKDHIPSRATPLLQNHLKDKEPWCPWALVHVTDHRRKVLKKCYSVFMVTTFCVVTLALNNSDSVPKFKTCRQHLIISDSHIVRLCKKHGPHWRFIANSNLLRIIEFIEGSLKIAIGCHNLLHIGCILSLNILETDTLFWKWWVHVSSWQNRGSYSQCFLAVFKSKCINATWCFTFLYFITPWTFQNQFYGLFLLKIIILKQRLQNDLRTSCNKN